jgi:hypothetical protein
MSVIIELEVIIQRIAFSFGLLAFYELGIKDYKPFPKCWKIEGIEVILLT